MVINIEGDFAFDLTALGRSDELSDGSIAPGFWLIRLG